MTIGRRWQGSRYLRLKGYIFERFKRVWGHDHNPPSAKVQATYDRYMRLVIALEKRQKEETC